LFLLLVQQDNSDHLCENFAYRNRIETNGRWNANCPTFVCEISGPNFISFISTTTADIKLKQNNNHDNIDDENNTEEIESH